MAALVSDRRHGYRGTYDKTGREESGNEHCCGRAAINTSCAPAAERSIPRCVVILLDSGSFLCVKRTHKTCAAIAQQKRNNA